MLKKRFLVIYAQIVACTYFISLIAQSLLKGGRWDLNQQIDFAQRLSMGSNTYANGITDLFPPSSPYFPGVGFISFLLNKAGLSDIQVISIVMLVFAWLVGILYFYLLLKITAKLFPDLSSNFIFLSLTLLFIFNLDFYTFYMIEFKPDTALLVIGSICFLMLIRQPDLGNFEYVVIGMLLFISAFLKQTFFLIFGLVFIQIFFNKFISPQKKIYLAISYICIGLLALILIFQTNNIYYHSVEILSMHPLHSFEVIMVGIKSLVIKNISWLLLLLTFIYIKLDKLFNLMHILQKPENKTIYFIFCMAWFLFAFVSSSKTGGNWGNIEAGIVVFAPFIIFSSKFLLAYLNDNFKTLAILVPLSIGFIISSYNALSFSKQYVFDKLPHDKEVIAFLAKRFPKANAFASGETYIVLKASGINIATDYPTVGHFYAVPGYQSTRLRDAFDSQYFDLLYTNYEIDLEDEVIQALIKKKYKILEETGMPQSLQNKIYIPKTL